MRGNSEKSQQVVLISGERATGTADLPTPSATQSTSLIARYDTYLCTWCIPGARKSSPPLKNFDNFSITIDGYDVKFYILVTHSLNIANLESVVTSSAELTRLHCF